MASADSARSSQLYWDNAAETYDRDFTTTLIGQLLRRRVWSVLDRLFRQGDRVLELNCGTGIDAQHLAERGVTVLACDVSHRMVEIARQRISAGNTGGTVAFQVLATEGLASLPDIGPFDGVFSNFSGLNCVDDLDEVRRNLARLLRPGASALVCMLGSFVPWEIAWYFAQGDRQQALRRFRQDSGHVHTGHPRVRYYSLRTIARVFAPDFRLRNWQGMGIFLPPTYMEHWARRFPSITRALGHIDALAGSIPVLKSMANFVLLEFRRQETVSTDNADHIAPS